MHDGQNPGDINQPVQLLPVLTQPANHRFRRGIDRAALYHRWVCRLYDLAGVGCHLADGLPAKDKQKAHPNQQVNRGVKQREQTEQPAMPDKLGDTSQMPERRERECQQKKPDGPLTGDLGQLLRGIRAQIILQDLYNHQRQRHKRQQEYRRLQPPAQRPDQGSRQTQ